MKRRAVMVIWRDAASHAPGDWTALPKKAGATITTVAMLVRKDPDFLVLAASFDDNDDPLYREVFSIPRSGVIEMRELSD